MKKTFGKISCFIDWIKEECKDWKTFAIFICVVLIVYFPTWGCYLLYRIFKLRWCLAIATGSLMFWLGPFTPFFPLCISITLAIKAMLKYFKKSNCR